MLGSSRSKWQKNQKSLCHRAEGSWPCLGKRQRVQKSLQAAGWSPCRLQVLLQPSHSTSARHIRTVCTSVRTADELRAPTLTRRNTLCSSHQVPKQRPFLYSPARAILSQVLQGGPGWKRWLPHIPPVWVSWGHWVSPKRLTIEKITLKNTG